MTNDLNQNPHLLNADPPSSTKKKGVFRRLFGISKTKHDREEQESSTSPPVTQTIALQSTASSIDNTLDNKQSISTDLRKDARPLPVSPKQTVRTPNIFPENVSKPKFTVDLPGAGDRIANTEQLVYCNTLMLLRENSSSHESPLSRVQLVWLAELERNPVQQDHLRWLVKSMVECFIQDSVKDATEIAEIVTLGTVLDKEYYRKLLSHLITEFDGANILDNYILQGLVQLVQSASPGYLEADDLIKTLSILRKRLENTHLQSTEHYYHLVVAVSRLLDVMADHNVKDLDRIQEHEPLSGVLSGLKGSTDPHLMYQACYAFQALQYIPDNESPLQQIRRYSSGAASGLTKVAGLVKLDLNATVEGLSDLKNVLTEVFSIASDAYEGACSIVESGQGIFDGFKEKFGSGKKRPWYAAIRAAYALSQAGHFKDLKQLIYEAPCRRDPLFQWGMCQLLAEITLDATNSVTTRQQAVELLIDLYRNDAEWSQDESVKTWILEIMGELVIIPDLDNSTTIHAFVKEVEIDHSALSTQIYPLQSRLPVLFSYPILAKVQKIPYIEYDLSRLRSQRLQVVEQYIYIPPMAKANLQARDDELFLLMDKVQEFLASERQVMLILGDSGAGKSTFNKHLELDLMRSYKSGGPIPLFINLPAIHEPNQDMVLKQLQIYNFTDDRIQEIKQHRQLVLICDGYDESQQLVNLHATNMLNQTGQWNTKMIISCRSQYLGQNYRDRFMPQGNGHYSRPSPHLFQEAVIAPFSKEQIANYVGQYVPLEPRDWSTLDYMDKLTAIPHLLELVRNPFLLTLALEALPAVIDGKEDLEDIEITRIQLYDIFVEHWLEVNKRRLESNALTSEERATLDQLLEVGFSIMGIDYSTRLATAIFEKQKGNPVVQYVQLKDKNTWRSEFFGPEPEIRLLRESSPLARTGSLFRFIHRSIQEYFFSRAIFAPSHIHDSVNRVSTQQQFGSQHSNILVLNVDGPLFKRSLLSEPSVIQFLCERVQKHSVFKQQLLDIIHQSKTDIAASIAATNAITILVRTGVTFNGADLRGIRIPGADLSGGQFDSTQFQDADLTGVNFAKSWLRQADFSGANLEDVRFEELPYLKHDMGGVVACSYSPDGAWLAVAQEGASIDIYDTVTWKSVHQLELRRSKVLCVTFTPDSRQIVFGDTNTVRMWAFADGKRMLYSEGMAGHSNFVRSLACSPCGKMVVSASRDLTLLVWSIETRAVISTSRGHTDDITCVKFLQDGQHIVSGSMDGTIRIWDAKTGEPGEVWTCIHGGVWSLAISPDGKRIASGHRRQIQLWDTAVGAAGIVLTGHTQFVTSVVFSPNGLWIASSSGDKTVKLWDVAEGTLLSTFTGHIYGVKDVVFSPDGLLLASGGDDHTVRLMQVNSNETTVVGPPCITGIRPYASFTHDGRYILSATDNGPLQRWNAQTGVSESNLTVSSKQIERFAISTDGTHIALGVYDSLQLWDCHTSTSGHILPGHTKTMTILAYSPCGRWVVASNAILARLWDLKNIEEGHIIADLSQVKDGYVCQAVFSPTDPYQLAISDSTGRIQLLDVQKRCILNETRIKETRAGATAYSPDGKELCLGSHGGFIYFWDLKSNEPVLGFDNLPNGWIYCASYSRCGQWIALACGDKSVRLLSKQLSAPDEEKRWSCAIVMNSFYGSVASIEWNPVIPLEFFTSCYDGSVRVWRVLTRDDGRTTVGMVWGSNLTRMCAEGLVIQGAIGLSGVHQKLLVQRGAIEP